MNQYEIDDAAASREAEEREKALAEGWRLVADAREAIDFCGDVARRLALWRADNHHIAEAVPLQAIETLARDGSL